MDSRKETKKSTTEIFLAQQMETNKRDNPKSIESASIQLQLENPTFKTEQNQKLLTASSDRNNPGVRFSSRTLASIEPILSSSLTCPMWKGFRKARTEKSWHSLAASARSNNDRVLVCSSSNIDSQTSSGESQTLLETGAGIDWSSMGKFRLFAKSTKPNPWIRSSADSASM